MRLKDLNFLVHSDLYRYTGGQPGNGFFRQLLFNPGFKYSFWMRICAFLHSRRMFRTTILPFAKIIHLHYTYKYGIFIPYETQVGSGLQIGHFGGIIVNEHAVIGKNCNISHDVTLGKANRGPRRGYPVVGDFVYLGPGAKIVGAVRIGNHAAVGANCVVTHDVPDNAVVGGVPGRIISTEGSKGYIDRTDY